PRQRHRRRCVDARGADGHRPRDDRGARRRRVHRDISETRRSPRACDSWCGHVVSRVRWLPVREPGVITRRCERRFASTSTSTPLETALTGARTAFQKNIARECGTSSAPAEWRVPSTLRGPRRATGAIREEDWGVLTTMRPTTLIEGSPAKTTAVLRA